MAELLRGELKLETSRTHLLYDRKTGAIVHAHTTVTFAGGASRSTEEEAARAREAAADFGYDMKRLEMLRVDDFDSSQLQRVDVKTRTLVPGTPKKGAAKGKKPAGKKTKRKK
jgi:hypothetical protein